MKNDGFVKLFRKIKNSAVFENADLLKLWILCLLKASHRGMEISINGKRKSVKIETGQFVTNRHDLWREYHQVKDEKQIKRKNIKPSKITLRNWLLQFQEMEMIEIETTNKYSIISIKNWEHYQKAPKQQKACDKKDEFLSDNWKEIYSNE